MMFRPSKSLLLILTSFLCQIGTLYIDAPLAVGCAPPIQQTLEDEYRVAAGYYSRGQWNETSHAFKSLIANHPYSEQASAGHFFLGEAMMQQGNYGEAFHTYQVFAKRLPNHEYIPRATFRMGEAAFRLGNLDGARRLLEIFVRENPSDSLNEFALPYLGEIRLTRKEPQLAQRAYETALRLYPNSHLASKCRLGLAKAFQSQGATGEALRFYQFVADEPGSPLAGEAGLRMGMIHFLANDFESANSRLQKALPFCDSTRSRAECSYWLARTLVTQNDYEGAFRLLASVADLDVNEELATAIYFDGAIAATKTGNEKTAGDWLENIRQQYPNNKLADDALHLQIELSQKSGELEETERLVYEFASQFPNSPLRPSVLESAGRNQYANKQFAESIAIFKQLLHDDNHVNEQLQDSDRANWHYFLGVGYLGLRDFSEAESALNMIDGDASSAQLRPLAQIAMATAKFGQEKYSDSIENYRRYLFLSPEGKEVMRARTELTVALAEASRWDETIGAFEELRLHHAGEPVILNTAEYLAKKANQESMPFYAGHWYEIMSEPGNPPRLVAEGLSGLAWMKMESNDTSSAMAFFERLLSECPDSEFSSGAAMARAKFLDDQKNFEQSSQLYDLVIRRFGSSDMASVAKLKRANALQKLGSKPNLFEAKALLEEYLQLPPDQQARDEALYQLAWVNLDLGLTDDGHEKFETLIGKFPKSKYWPDAAYRIATHLVKQNNYEAAQPVIESLLNRKDVPTEVLSRVLYLQGEVASRNNEWETVSLSMRTMLQRSDDTRLQAKANYWLAESLYRQQQFKAASDIFRTLRNDTSDLDAKLKPWVWLRHAQCLGQNGDWEQAQEIAESGLKTFSDFKADYEFDFVRARALEDSGKLTSAREIYKLVVDSTRGGSTETAAIAQWRIAETFFHQENYKAAIEGYFRVDSLFAYEKWRSAALLQAGKCQEHLNNWKHAKKLYTQLLEKFPQSQYADGARARIKRVSHLAKLQQETNPKVLSSQRTKSR